jgi:hypothetical protein
MSLLGLDSTSVTAYATVVLALITIYYAYITNSILNEQKKTRKIEELHKKLECFYIPLWQHILLQQYPPSSEKALEFYYAFNEGTAYKDFMKYMYLCENKEIRSDLEMLLDSRKRPNLQAGLVSHLNLIENDIKKINQELKELQGF